MKKNKTLRLAAALLILVLLTTGIISGTFAKYVTEGKASDTARVAKWGVTVTTSGSLYSNAYAEAKIADKGNLPTAWTAASPAADAITVTTKENIADDNIVAPGTKSYEGGLSFGISGTPEVAVKVGITVSAEDIFLKTGTYGVLVPVTVSDTVSLRKVIAENNADGRDVYSYASNAYTKLDNTATYATGTTYYVLTSKVTLDADYFPVKYKLEGTTNLTDTTAVKVADELAKAINGSTAPAADTDPAPTSYKTSYTGLTKDYPANTDLATAGPKFGGERLSWEWAYDKKNADNSVDPNIDACDTVLGDLIAARGVNDPGYKVVAIDGTTITELTIKTGENDYTVTDGTGVVANLRTMVDISLSVTQVD